MDSTVIMSAEEEITQEELIDKIKTDKCLDSDLFINKRHEMEIHLKFSDSIHIKSKSLKQKEIRFRLSLEDFDDQTDNQSNGISNNHKSLIEISVMNGTECQFQPQQPNGRHYDPKEYVLMRTKVTEMEETAILIELLVCEPDCEPKRVGFCNIFGSNLKESKGIVSMPFNGENNKIVAQLQLEYLILNPIKGFEDFHKMISVESWLKNVKDIGHRGAGIARRTDRIENILENTIASFNFASLHGADMVELDVQLSKDKIPLVYHDFDVNIIMKNKKAQTSGGRPSTEVHTMPIKDLTFSQLQHLQLSPVLKANKPFYDFGEEDQREENMPFASFQKVLELVDPKCAFNVEIKYPQQKISGQWESETTFDLNEYVDIIVSTVFEYGGKRNIMFSCFHPDICAMLKYKQNRYPVLFLTQGLTKKWQKFKDPRNQSIEMASYFALSIGLDGINAHAEDIINDKSLIQFVKSKDLILFCWGDDLNKTELIAELKKEGVDGVVYDKIDILCGKSVAVN